MISLLWETHIKECWSFNPWMMFDMEVQLTETESSSLISNSALVKRCHSAHVKRQQNGMFIKTPLDNSFFFNITYISFEHHFESILFSNFYRYTEFQYKANG